MTTTKSLSGGKLYGRLSVKAYDERTGKCVYRIAKQNQVTNHGRVVVLDLLAQLATGGTTPQENPTWNQIWSIGIGASEIPAAAYQTTLIDPVWNQALEIPDGREKVDDAFEIRVTAEIAAGTATDEIFAEAGLFTRGIQDAPDGVYTTWESIPSRRLYARQTFPSFTKGETMRVVFEWVIGMTVSA
jgi:hypothetical protein